jgi:phosphopentomutase
VVYGKKVKSGLNLGTRATFADISATVLDYFGVPKKTEGSSFLKDMVE